MTLAHANSRDSVCQPARALPEDTKGGTIMWIGRLTMPNGTSTGRRAVAPLAIMAALLGAALLIAYAGVPLAEAQSPPGTPSSVSLTRADGTVTASWPAVSGATKYHVTYSSDGKQSWSAASDSHTSNSITFNADNGKWYIVGVRAGNGAEQWSGWRNSPSIGPYTPPDPDPTPTPTPAPNPPGTPSSVTVTRGDGTVSADWPDVSGATKYHVTYSTDNRQSWSHATSSRPYSDITINNTDNAKTYIVAVRAGNSAGWGGWRNSDPAGPYVTTPSAPASVTVTRGDGTITASWDAPAGATKYHVTYSANGKRTWTAASDNHTSSSITITANNGKTYHVAVRAGNSAGWSGWRNSAASAPTATPGIIVQDSSGNAITSLTVPEGGEATYQVKLASKPDAYVEICIGLSVRDRNDGSITFKDEPAGTVAIKVPFTPENWNTAQTVTLVAAEDDDSDNGVRDVINDTRDFVEYFSGAVWLEVTEIDNDPIPGPDNLSVTPGDGYMDIAWDAVSGATGYDVKAQAANTSGWITVASNITTTSHRYTTSATIDKVGVRSRNANGPGPWTELSRAPNENWLNTVQQSGGAAMAMAMAESQAQGQSQTKLTAPTLGTITRENGRDPTINVNWTAVTGATGYYVVCSSSNGWSWWRCGTVTSGSTTTVSITEEKQSGVELGRNRSYTVAVRAVNATPADASDWTVSDEIHPVIQYLTGLTTTRGNGSITVSWTPNPHTTGYQIDCAEVDTTQAFTPPSYTSCATLTNQDDTATKHTVTLPHSRNSSYTIDNSKTYDIRITATNQWDTGGKAKIFVPLVGPLSLGATSVGTTTATIAVSNFTAAWWYKRTAPTGDNTCHSVAAGTTSADLSSLTPGVAYTYKAYSASNCASANEIATLAFTTGSSVSNLSETPDNIGAGIYDNYGVGFGFTTGSNSGGYAVRSVTVKFRASRGNPAGFKAAIHASNGANPANSALYTLIGDAPTGAGQITYTCSGSCRLAKTTTYYLVLTGTGSGYTNAYTWDTTASTTETNSANFGWSIADDARVYYNSAWSTQTGWIGLFQVTATNSPSLTAEDIVANGATLTVTNHTGAWYYKANTGPDANCKGPVNGASQEVRGLTKGGTYTYSAYSDSGCTNANLLATAAAFTTPTIGVSGIGENGASLLISNYSGQQWWYNADTGPHTSCQGPVGTRNPVTLSGLTKGTPYTYTAYSESGCANADFITSAYFTTTAVELTVSNIAATTATLNLDGHSTDWYYKANAAPDNTCKGPVTNSSAASTKDLTGLTSGSTYTYKAYSDSGCSTTVATATAFTTGASYATNLNSAKAGESVISSAVKQAVAFTTGSSANGYTLSSVTLPLRQKDPAASLTITLHQMQGAGTYSASSSPSDTVLATLTGTAPSSSAWADTTYTCSGSGCSLSASTTYFIVATGTRVADYAWAYATTNTESTYPTNSGWDIRYGHNKSSAGRPWSSVSDYHPVRVVFTTVAVPTLSAGSIGATNAVLTIANHTGSWYYKADTGPHTSCSSAQSGATATLTGLTAGTTYTYKAYSDSGCTTANLVATASAFTTAITAGNLGETTGTALLNINNLAYGQAFTTGSASNGYTLLSATLDFANVLNASSITVSIRSEASNQPGSTDLATLSGTPASGQQTFTCSGSGCNLSASTTYYVYVVATGTNAGNLSSTASDNETLAPSTNGWSIANAVRYEQGAWTEHPSSAAMKVELEAVAR